MLDEITVSKPDDLAQANPHRRVFSLVQQDIDDLKSYLLQLDGSSGDINLPPTASFTANPGSGGAPLTVSFTDTSTDDGTINAWSWDFGDGGTSSLPNPSHTFTAVGDYTVSLTVTDSLELSSANTATTTINVSAPEAPGEASNPTPADGASDVDTAVDLAWSAGSQATSHDVYFGDSTTPPLVSHNQVGASYDPGELTEQTTYYWRVDEVNAVGTTVGVVLWSFTTRDAGPADTITISKAEWKANRGELKVEGTSTGAPAAVLTVVGFGEMTYDAGKNTYKFVLRPVNSYPGTVTVTSSLGGSATKAVRLR
jgi:PKD repeat protein